MGQITKPQILFGNVMHARLFPKKNAFSYGIYYIALPLSQRHDSSVAYNRFGLLSFYDRDHGPCNGDDLEQWIHEILKGHHIDGVTDITLMCMPRVLGYVFNPVSFWICRNKGGVICAILCEVHNTFGEKHSYLCSFVESENKTMTAQKTFHVSPFLERDGHYEFKFDITEKALKIDIDYYDVDGQKQLATYLKGDFVEMNKSSLRKAFWCYPLVTIKAITLIHWQALKLIAKGIKYIPKPRQKDITVSVSDNLTNI